MPPVPITDLTMRHGKLVVATQGRGFYILDDVATLRQLVRHYSSEESDFDRCVKNNMVPRLAYKQEYPPVKPGTYQARITVAGETLSVADVLEPDPYSAATADDYVNLEVKLAQSAKLVNDALNSLKAMCKATSQINALMSNYSEDQILMAAGKQALSNIDLWSAKVTQRHIEVYEDEDHWPSMLDVQARHLFDVIDAAGAPIAKGALDRLADLTALWQILKAERDLIMSRDIKAINELAKASKINHVSVMKE
jgi:hypothetical protein